MKRVLPVVEPHAFAPADLVGGNVALDFINTITGWNGAPRDWLSSFEALLDWAALAGVVAPPARRVLSRAAAAEPGAGLAALDDARQTRELLHQIAAELLAKEPPPEGRLYQLHARWQRSVAQSQLAFVDGGIQPAVVMTGDNLECVVDAVVYRAVQLFTSWPADRLRTCAGSDCGWLFLDISKAGRRRWCDMATCGNDEKTRRFTKAHKSSAARRS